MYQTPSFEQISKLDSFKIFFTDLNGRALALPVNPENIRTLVEEGIGFDASSTAGISTVDDSDRLLFPLPDTSRIIKIGDEAFGFGIGIIKNGAGTRSRSDARAILERVLERAEADFGCRFLAGPEHEFFLLKGDEMEENAVTPSDNAGYFHADPHDKGELVRMRIISVLKTAGIQFEKAHHEVTHSQHEINLECLPPLAAADRTILFNYVTKKVAATEGFHATFMPKPFDQANRNAFHIHLSMQDLEGNNLFYEENAEFGLSQRARHFIAGIVKYGRATSIVMASTFNSYKAYILEREAPVLRGWGIKNRSSMVRVPHATRPSATRVEIRNPDPCGNVYLQMAALIAMGLKGIEEAADCGKPDVGSVYQKKIAGQRVLNKRLLPKCMFEALMEAEKSSFLKDLLGPRLFDHYLNLKLADWEEHRTHVTPREHKKYLNV